MERHPTMPAQHHVISSRKLLCSTCGLALEPEFESRSDVSPACARCQRTGVRSLQGVKACLELAGRLLASSGVIVPFEHVGISTRASLPGRAVGILHWQQQYGDVRPICRSLHIEILSGLPRVAAVGACAHELGHVWLRQVPRRLPAPVEEGTANVFKFLALRGMPCREAAWQMRVMFLDRSPEYGVGFRVCWKRWNQLGAARYLAALRTYARPVTIY